jgi:hypothetical protein
MFVMAFWWQWPCSSALPDARIEHTGETIGIRGHKFLEGHSNLSQPCALRVLGQIEIFIAELKMHDGSRPMIGVPRATCSPSTSNTRSAASLAYEVPLRKITSGLLRKSCHSRPLPIQCARKLRLRAMLIPFTSEPT